MDITAVGYVLIPLGLFAVLFKTRRPLLYLTIFFSPFTATAVVNFENPAFGVQPAYFFGLLFMVRVALEILEGRLRIWIPPVQRSNLLIFWLFVLAAITSIALIPLYGPILVHRPSGEAVSLSLTRENITQLMYILYVITFVTSVALSRLGPKELDNALKVLIMSGLFVSLWGWFQIISHYLGLPYPDFIFNNSNSFSQNFGQILRNLSIKRMNSVAPEPSMLARFLVIPTFICFYCSYKKQFLFRHKHAIFLAVFFSITLLCTTSASAVAGFLGGLFIFSIPIFVSSRNRQRSTNLLVVNKRSKITFVTLIALTLFIIGVVGFGLAKWKFGIGREQASALLDIIVMEKLESQSGQTRLGGALAGLDLFITHPLLGIGWGSNRTFDLLTNLLSTTGIIGTFLFFLGHLMLVGRVTRLRKVLDQCYHSSIAAYLEVLLLVLAVRMFTKIVSEPGLTFLDHWIIVGLMISALRWPVLLLGRPANGRKRFFPLPSGTLIENPL